MDSTITEIKPPPRQGRARNIIFGLILAGAMLLIFGGIVLAMNLVRSQSYQPQYQLYQSAGAVLKANTLPGSRVEFSATVDKTAFLQYQDNDKNYPVYQWTEGSQRLEARFSSKLKQLPDGKITISASVQSRSGDVLFIFVDKFSQG